jgi:hypothetical protein
VAGWDKFFVYNPLDLKERDDHTVDIVFHLPGPFLALMTWGFSTGRVVDLSQGPNHNPALITNDDPGRKYFIIGGELTKFSADVDAVLLVVSRQDPGRKFGCNMVHSKIFRQNPLACPLTNPHLLSNVVNGPTSILTEELLNSCKSFRSRAASGSPCVFVFVN